MIKYNDEKKKLFKKMLDNLNDYKINSLKVAELIKKDNEDLKANYKMMQINENTIFELVNFAEVETVKLLQFIGGYDE